MEGECTSNQIRHHHYFSDRLDRLNKARRSHTIITQITSFLITWTWLDTWPHTVTLKMYSIFNRDYVHRYIIPNLGEIACQLIHDRPLSITTQEESQCP